MAPKFGRKNPWPKCNALLLSEVMQGSTRGQLAQKCPMAPKLGRKNLWPKWNALLGSKVMQGSARVNQRSNWLEMAIKSVGRTSDLSILHCWDQRSCRGQPAVKLLENPQWPPDLVAWTPDQSVTHCWGQSHKGSTRGQLLRNASDHEMQPISL